jgi:hypothetical protein
MDGEEVIADYLGQSITSLYKIVKIMTTGI